MMLETNVTKSVFRTTVAEWGPKSWDSEKCSPSYLLFFFPHQIFLIRLRICFDPGFPGGSVVTNTHANAADAGSISGWGRSPGEGNGNPFQFSFLGNHMMVYGPLGRKRVGHYLATKQQNFVPLMVSFLRIPLYFEWIIYVAENLCYMPHNC